MRRAPPSNPLPTIQSSNRNVVAVVRTALGSNTILSLEAKAPGEAVLSIVQPPGYSAPAGRARLAVRVRQPQLTFSGPVSLGKDLMRAVTVRVPRGATEQLTITSSDPSRLRVSANDATEGSASFTVRPNGDSHLFYIHALTGEGAAQVSASLPGFVPAEMTVHLRPVYLNVLPDGAEDAGTLRPDGVFATTTASPRVPLSIVMNGFDDSTGFLRIGAAPIELQLVSSRPGVGAAVATRRIEPGVQGLARGAGEFRPSGAGETEISVVPPAGFVAPPPSAPRARFAVTAPGFEPSNRVLPKDTTVTALARLPRHVRFNAATTVTTTSPDPARLLLGSEARITRTIAAGEGAAEFPIQALGESGVVPLTLSAPGMADCHEHLLNASARSVHLTRQRSRYRGSRAPDGNSVPNRGARPAPAADRRGAYGPACAAPGRAH